MEILIPVEGLTVIKIVGDPILGAPNDGFHRKISLSELRMRIGSGFPDLKKCQNSPVSSHEIIPQKNCIHGIGILGVCHSIF